MKRLESQNELQRFEWEKWDVAANTNYYPINGVSQALYRIYQSQYGDLPGWHEMDKKVRKIMEKCVEQRINSFPLTRHRVIAWSCAPLYYSNWCTWAYNCWGLNTIINMDSLMFNMTIRTDSYSHTLPTWPSITSGPPCAGWPLAVCTTSSSCGRTWKSSTATWWSCMTNCCARACRRSRYVRGRVPGP